MDEPTTSPTAPAHGPQPASNPATPGGWRMPVGRVSRVLVVVGAVVLSLWVWNVTEHYPRTRDAVAVANVVGIVPRVRGQIVKLNVKDNQAVAAGDLRFEIDP